MEPNFNGITMLCHIPSPPQGVSATSLYSLLLLKLANGKEDNCICIQYIIIYAEKERTLFTTVINTERK